MEEDTRFNDIIVAPCKCLFFFFFFRPPHDRALHFLNPFHRAEDYFTILRCHGISCVYDATLTSLPPGEEREKWWDVDEEPSSNAS